MHNVASPDGAGVMCLGLELWVFGSKWVPAVGAEAEVLDDLAVGGDLSSDATTIAVTALREKLAKGLAEGVAVLQAGDVPTRHGGAELLPVNTPTVVKVGGDDGIYYKPTSGAPKPAASYREMSQRCFPHANSDTSTTASDRSDTCEHPRPRCKAAFRADVAVPPA